MKILKSGKGVVGCNTYILIASYELREVGRGINWGSVERWWMMMAERYLSDCLHNYG